MMYCFAKICCLCLQYNQELNKLDDTDSNGVTFFEKLIVLMPGFEKLVTKSIPKYICRKCKRYLNKFFKFQQHCFKSYKLLESYVKQLDTSKNGENVSELSVIEDDLILIKEDMEECLKNMEIYIKVEDNEVEEQISEQESSSPKEQSPKPETSCRKRTRECKKVSYNEEYDSDTMISDSELYYTKGAKRKAKPRRKSEQAMPKEDKTVVIPQNDVFAKDLTKTINDIITRLSADTAGTSKPEEFQVNFKNSAGNTEELSIYQEKDSVEVKFTKEEKQGYLKVCRSGDSFILTHNITEANGVTKVTETEEVPKTTPPEDVWSCTICGEKFKSCYTLTKHVNNYMNFQEVSCKICDKKFDHVAELRSHIHIHSSVNDTGSSENDSQSSISSESLQLEEKESSVVRVEDPKRNQYCEIKVVLSGIQENGIKSERSSSPEYQFHLSDDTDEDDEFDNDTVILGELDQNQENDFPDTGSPSPVLLSSEVLEFLEREEVPENDIPMGREETIASSNNSTPEDVLPPINGHISEGDDCNNSLEEKLLKVVINKTEVDDFMKSRSEGPKRLKERKGSRQSPRIQVQVCPQCKEPIKTQGKLEEHLKKVHEIVTHNTEA